MSFAMDDDRPPERLTPGRYSLVYRPTPLDTDTVEFELHGPVDFLRRFSADASFELLQLIEPDWPDAHIDDYVMPRLKAALTQATASFMRSKIEDEGHLPSEHLDLRFDDDHVALARLVQGTSPLPVPEDYAVVGRFERPHAPPAPSRRPQGRNRRRDRRKGKR